MQHSHSTVSFDAPPTTCELPPLHHLVRQGPKEKSEYEAKDNHAGAGKRGVSAS